MTANGVAEESATQTRRLQRDLERAQFSKEYLTLCLRTGWQIVGVPTWIQTPQGFTLQVGMAPQLIPDDRLSEVEQQLQQLDAQGIR